MNKKFKKIIISLTPVILGMLIERVVNAAFNTFNWLWWLVGGILTMVIILVYVLPGYLSTFDTGRKIGIVLVSLSTLVVACLYIWEQVVGPEISSTLVDQDQVVTLIRRERWITYDPTQFNPYSISSELSLNSIDAELGWIKNAGFTGIITFTSRGNFAEIPQLAKKHGLAVIMGIWDPTDENEVKKAIAARDFVDGYSIGHNGLGIRYSYQQLESTIQLVRFQTRHPVSTTEKMASYLVDIHLLGIGDWIFPDVHVSVQESDSSANPLYLADAERDSLSTISMAKQLSEMKEKDGRPILLKMVTYPMSGTTNASLLEQASFFVAILDGRRDVVPDMPLDISIAVHSAFDAPWKISWPFYEWDPYTGLLDNTGTPRPAIEEIIKRLP